MKTATSRPSTGDAPMVNAALAARSYECQVIAQARARRPPSGVRTGASAAERRA